MGGEGREELTCGPRGYILVRGLSCMCTFWFLEAGCPGARCIALPSRWWFTPRPLRALPASRTSARAVAYRSLRLCRSRHPTYRCALAAQNLVGRLPTVR